MSSCAPKRSVIIAGRRTSVSLEEPFWAEFVGIARRIGKTVNDLVTEIDVAGHGTGKLPRNLSSDIRLYVLADLKARVPA